MQISTISTVCYYLPELVENSLFEQEKTFFRNLNSDDILFFLKKKEEEQMLILKYFT